MSRSRATLQAAQVLVSGTAEGAVIGTDTMISFWGGVDPASGRVIDRRHPLHGQTLTGKVFVLPKGKGSSTGSAVLLDALVAGHAPAGILLNRVDEIISLGVVVYEAFFGRTIPVIVLDDRAFAQALAADHACIAADGSVVLDEVRHGQ
jgi:predicted aconitase with swiveling domain